MNLFVYGTLKRECRNHHLLGNSTFLGEFKTKPKYRLFELENGAFPMMVKDETKGYPVAGEVWQVSPTRVSILDMHEALYHRELIDVEELQNVQGYLFDAWPDPRLVECYQWNEMLRK